jgi:hypothetical protein
MKDGSAGAVEQSLCEIIEVHPRRIPFELLPDLNLKVAPPGAHLLKCLTKEFPHERLVVLGLRGQPLDMKLDTTLLPKPRPDFAAANPWTPVIFMSIHLRPLPLALDS